MLRPKLWSLLSVILIIAFILAACGPTPTPQTIEVTKEVQVTVEKTVTVEVTKEVPVAVQTVMYNSYNGDPIPRAFDEAIVKAWNEQNPKMPVEHSIIAHEDFKQAIRAYLTANPAPDVLTWFAGNRTRFFIDKGLVKDFDAAWAANKFDEVYAPGFKALATYNGKKYFLPTSYYWWAITTGPPCSSRPGLRRPPRPGTSS